MVVDTTHLRADAQRNLERILEAARAVFAEEGLEASVADVAERAGVGTATIFRRFPTKDDLVAAILEREIGEVVTTAQAASEGPDPAAGLREFVFAAVESFVHGRTFCEAKGTELFQRPKIQDLFGEVKAAIELLLQRAKAAGAIRPDVVSDDIGFLINALGQAGLRDHAQPGEIRRYVEIMLDGLRPRPPAARTGSPRPSR